MSTSTPGRMSNQQLTMLLAHEISNVLTAMKHQSTWSHVAAYDQDVSESTSYEWALRELRSQIYEYTDFRQVDPMAYLAPFLDLLKASDVSGPITGAVALAIRHILESDLITIDTVNAGPAINQLVDDTVQGKFSSTDQVQDEVVLLNIVQVLERAVDCKASVLLTDDVYRRAFNAAFMLGDPVTKPEEYGEIMAYYSRQVCVHIVRTLFTRLRLMAEAGASIVPHNLSASGNDKGASILALPGGGQTTPLRTATSVSNPEAHDESYSQARAHSHFTLHQSSPLDPPQVLPLGATGSTGGISTEGLQKRLSCKRSMDLTETTAIMNGMTLNDFNDDEDARTTYAMIGAQPCMHGVRAAYNILNDLTELIRKREGYKDNRMLEDSIVLVMDMVHAALVAAGPALMKYDTLVPWLHVELLHAMCEAVLQLPFVGVINSFCQVLCAMYSCLGDASIPQIEVVLTKILMRLAEDPNLSVQVEGQEVALEGILELLRAPGFLQDMFVNCDCRLERGNLFEDLVALLSRTAQGQGVTQAAAAVQGQPQRQTLGPTFGSRLVSLEALNAVIRAIAGEDELRYVAEMPVPTIPENTDLPCFVDCWTPMVSGQLLDFTEVLGHSSVEVTTANNTPAKAAKASSSVSTPTASEAALKSSLTLPVNEGGVLDASELMNMPNSATKPSLAPIPESVGGALAGVGALTAGGAAETMKHLKSAIYEKHFKRKLRLAIDFFNKDHKKGLAKLQDAHLLPYLEGSPAAKAAMDAAPADKKHLVQKSIVSEADLARILGRFLHSCPGLNKTTIGELLGEPDEFYIKVLDSYTTSFNFQDLKFVAAMRLFIESFSLPGEAQKIDRIINSFGRHFYNTNKGIFNHSDAAYVLAYSIIMLNTDLHNPQVKRKMDMQSFKRNLRGVNDNQDFDQGFLEEIFYSIAESQLMMEDSASMKISEQSLLDLHQISRTPRGRRLETRHGRHLFAKAMYQLAWGPIITALSSFLNESRPAKQLAVEQALEGLLLSVAAGAAHGMEDVTDTVVTNICRSKLTGELGYIWREPLPRPSWQFGRDASLQAIVRTVVLIANKFGDSLTIGWQQVMDLLMVLYRQGIMPDTFTRALDGDGEGGLAVRDGEASSLRVRRIAAARAAQAAGQRGLLGAVQYFLGAQPQLPESGDPFDAGMPLREDEIQIIQQGADVIAQSSPEDIFLDASYLPESSLVHLVRAVIASAGSIPKPPGQVPTAAGSYSQGWDVAELSLELLFGILLRNRDRIAAVWPGVHEHFKAIFSNSNDVDRYLVQKAIMGVMRLCLRLLPYKRHIADQLIKGVQLVSLVDSSVAADMAPTIAQELLSMLKGAAPYLQSQQVWVALTGLLKIIQYDSTSFPACVEGLAWVVRESLSVYNFPLILQALVDLIERAAERAGKGQPLLVTSATLALVTANGADLKSRTPGVSSSGAQRSYSHSQVTVASSAPLKASQEAILQQTSISSSPVIADDLNSNSEQVQELQPGVSAGGSPRLGGRSHSMSGGSSRMLSPPGLHGDPNITILLNLLQQAEEWLEVWWLSQQQDGSSTSIHNNALLSSGVASAAAVAAAQEQESSAMQQIPDSPGLRQPRTSDALNIATFQQEAWAHLVSSLCRAIKNSNLQVRLGALDVLQRAVVAAEKLQVPAPTVQRVLQDLILPITNDMIKVVHQGGSAARDFPQADSTVKELVRALAKVVLLYAPQMGNISAAPCSTAGANATGSSAGPQGISTHPSGSHLKPQTSGGTASGSRAGSEAMSLVVGSTWGPAWRGILECMVNGMQHAAPRSEVLSEAIPEAMKNMVLMLHAKGALREGWRDGHDGGTDLTEATWRAAKKISGNLTPAILQLAA